VLKAVRRSMEELPVMDRTLPTAAPTVPVRQGRHDESRVREGQGGAWWTTVILRSDQYSLPETTSLVAILPRHPSNSADSIFLISRCK
jgi:hypothetical protein